MRALLVTAHPLYDYLPQLLDHYTFSEYYIYLPFICQSIREQHVPMYFNHY